MASIRVRDNQRYIARGITYRNDSQTFHLDMKQNEVNTVSLEFADVLATSETLTATVLEKDMTLSASVSGSVVTVSATQSSYTGTAKIKVARSGGRVEVFDFVFASPASAVSDDYGLRVA